ncbi:hypothetical protein FS837_002056 [Tulasnella sp. UAMH 9824]|nr:hypothetical protein FS837_002056 [Tulasnella sp. UAMH 9824]
MFTISGKLTLTLALAISATAAPLFAGLPASFERDVDVARRSAKRLRIKRLVAFGDSFSDNGTGIWVLTNGTWPADPAYYNHEFSNGPVWPVHLSEALGIKLDDKAIGGATTDNAIVQGLTGWDGKIPVPSVLDQISQYISQTPIGDDEDDTLYAIVGGANDIFYSANTTAESVVQAIAKGMKQLQDGRGASNFLLASYPPLNTLPFVDKYTPPEYHTILSTYSQNLANGLSSIASSPPNGTRIAYVDLYTVLPQVLAQPESYGFSPEVFNQNCLNGAYKIEGVPRSVCSDPDARAFWDVYHPSAKTHQIIAAEAAKAVEGVF